MLLNTYAYGCMDGQNQNPSGMPMNNSQPPLPYQNVGYGEANGAPLNPIEHPGSAPQTQPAQNPYTQPVAPQPAYQQPVAAPQTDPQLRAQPAPTPTYRQASMDIQPTRSHPVYRPIPAQAQPAATVSQPLSTAEPVQASETVPAKEKKSRLAFLSRFKSKKIALASVGAAVFILVGSTVYSRFSSNMKNFSIKNGNYTYSFNFYSSSSASQFGGVNSYTYKSKNGKMIASVQPTDESPANNCSALGDKWQQVSSVSINGSDRPICTTSAGSLKAYDVIFAAQNSNHLFLITTYNDPGSASSNSSLKAIFGSVKV